MQIPFRHITKSTLTIAVNAVTYVNVKSQLAEHTEIDEDSFTAEFAAGCAGGAVAAVTKPMTDALVDKIADRVIALKNRKSAPETTETL